MATEADAARLEEIALTHDPRLPFQRRLLPLGCGTALRKGREADGRSRREVAAAVGIAPRTLARIEREQQRPTWPTLDRLCDEVGVSVAQVARRWLDDSFDVPDDPVTAPGIGLRALRRSRGMKLVELSRLSGVSASTLSRFERGLTASRLLARRVGGPEVALDDRAVLLDSPRVATAFGLAGPEALRAACLHAARSAADGGG